MLLPRKFTANRSEAVLTLFNQRYPFKSPKSTKSSNMIEYDCSKSNITSSQPRGDRLDRCPRLKGAIST